MNSAQPTRVPFDIIERLFPFSFFEEVHALMNERIANATPDTRTIEPEFRLANPIWLLFERKAARADMFARQRDARRADIEPALFLNQIVSVEPFGDLLILELCIRSDATDDFKDPLKRSQLPLAFLAVQYYDADGAPYLTHDRLATLPAGFEAEQLGLFVVEMNAHAPLVSVLTAPDIMYDRWSEDVDTLTKAGDPCDKPL